MNLKAYGGRWSWPNISYYLGVCIKGLKKYKIVVNTASHWGNI